MAERLASSQSHSPDANVDKPIGGVVLVTQSHRRSEAHKLQEKEKNTGNVLMSALQSAGLAALDLNLPARRSAGANRRLENGTAEQSVKEAIKRLSARCGENGDRIAIIAEGQAADDAVLGARSEGEVRLFVLLSGRLGHRAKDVLSEWQENPALGIVSSEDKSALRDLTDIYFNSKNSGSDLRVFEGLGQGLEMVDRWKKLFPQREPLERTVAEWLRRELSFVGRAREVSFDTEDGWKIFGNLLIPDPAGKPAQGVVLLHSGRSDRYVFTNLERLLLRAGFAVLNIDWRGRGKSINKGRYFDLSKDERANGKLDAKAAINFLTSQNGVDHDHIALVGIIHGAEHAVRASIGDSRVKALAILHGYVPADDTERSFLTSGKVHIMYVTSQSHTLVTKSMNDLYSATPDKLTRFLVFPGGAIGYQLFELDEKFEPTIVEWLKEAMVQ